MAHELRNPLAGIEAWTELALEPDAPPEDVREGLATIQIQARRMADMVQEMLGFSRTRDDGLSVCVHDLVSRQLRMQRMARGKGVRIVERIEWRGEATMQGARIEQILANLVSNAADSAPAGTGVIEVTLSAGVGDFLLEVEDNGPGIAAEVADRIFDPFVTTKPAGAGTGLGLAISRRLATSMEGSLTASPSSTGGALFTLRLPLAPPKVAGDPSRRMV